MIEAVIKVEGLSKQYRLGQVGRNSINQDVNRWWHMVRGKGDPYLKIGQENDRTQKSTGKYVWALQDINFDVKKGEVLGIIGRNGAGKSTLLKLLSKVTAPTTGAIKVKGRIASLLEVGTGFHPDLSGRDNIYLNGAILGMTKKEITAKFDEIVDFSGVEKYIDTPVKRYSSGMYVRLAFAVAAHLEPEILIVDEVLAVGDVEFQKKCLGKMRDVSVEDGRTVLFVSHNMAAIQRLCNRGLLVDKGKMKMLGNIDDVVASYLDTNAGATAVVNIPTPENAETPAYITRLQIEDLNGTLMDEVPVGRGWQIRINFTLRKAMPHFIIALGISDTSGLAIKTTWSEEGDYKAGEYEAVFAEKEIFLAAGKYYLTIGLSSYERSVSYYENVSSLLISDIIDKTLDKTVKRFSARTGFVLNPMQVTINTF